MNQTTYLWAEKIHHDPMVSASESHNLSSFLEFGLDFSALNGSVHDGQCLEDNEVMAITYSASMKDFDTAAVPRMDPATQKQIIRQYLQFQQQHNMRRLDFEQALIVPPTSNSMKLHEETTKYCQHIDANSRVLYERQPRSKEDQVRQKRAPYT
jgi:hypothetical protein